MDRSGAWTRTSKGLITPSGALLRNHDNGFIYFVQQGDDGPVKIGWSYDPKNRIDQLQTANPAKLCLLGSYPGSEGDERELHKSLSKHRVRGEWFKPCDEVMAYATGEEDLPRAPEQQYRVKGGYNPDKPPWMQNGGPDPLGHGLPVTGNCLGQRPEFGHVQVLTEW